MGEIILYITHRDAEQIRTWLNSEPEIAWIVRADLSGTEHTWKAVDEIPEISCRSHALWHRRSGRLTIPSGSLAVPDTVVFDPYKSWIQHLDEPHDTPWLGGNLPGLYEFTCVEQGKERPGSLGRSGFNWAGDHFRPIGMGASAPAKKWWQRLRRYVKKNARGIPWGTPFPTAVRGEKVGAYAFDDAYSQIYAGRPVDVNP